MCAIFAFLFRVSLAGGMYFVLFAVDVLAYSATSYFLGLYGTGGMIGAVLALLGALLAHQYFHWRRNRRMLWLHQGKEWSFLLPWMRYADLCADTLHPRLCAWYLILFALGTLCALL